MGNKRRRKPDRKKRRRLNAISERRSEASVRAGSTEATITRAQALLRAGRIDEAESLLLAFLRRHPEDLDIAALFSRILIQTGRETDAIQLLQQMALRHSNRSQACTVLGETHLMLGRLRDAEDAFSRALNWEPNNARAHAGQGTAALELGHLRAGYHHYQEAYKFDPDHPGYAAGLADAALRNGAIDEGLRLAREALRKTDDSPRMLGLYARALSEACLFEQAEETYLRVLAKQPDSNDAINGLANIYLAQGRDTDAANILDELLGRVGPKHLHAPSHTAQLLGRIAKRTGDIDSGLRAVRSIAAAHRSNRRVVMTASFEEGQLLERASRYDDAWIAYERANSSLEVPDDLDQQLIAHTDSIMRAFSADAMRDLPRSSVNSSRPVFIIGMPRSGTTLVERTLAAHPNVAAGGELITLSELDLFRQFRHQFNLKSTFPEFVPRLTSARIDWLARQYLKRLKSISSDAARVTDKLPHNYVNLGLIARMFPKCKVLHCTRESLDTCVSCFASQLPTGHAWAYRLETIGQAYGEYRRLMQHWRDVLDIEILDVPYKEVVADHDTWSRRLIEYVGLNWDDAPLRFYEETSDVRTLSADQVRQQIYTTSIGRHKRFESHLKPLRARLEQLGIDTRGPS